MDNFKAIAAFVQAARLGSFGKAAVELGITQQQVSKLIKQFENELGTRLFNRTTRRISLTDTGERLLTDVTDSMDRLASALSSARSGQEELKGTVRITAPQAIGRSLVVPLLAEFHLRYPEIVVDLLVDDHMTDLVAQRIDLGLRAGTMQDGRLVARKLVPIQHIVCAAPQFVSRRGTPDSVADLQRFPCTGFRHINTGKVLPWEFAVGNGIDYLDLKPVFITNDVDVECQAVLDGIGIGQLASFTAAVHIHAGRLTPLLIDTITERFALYLYYPTRTRIPERVRLLREFLLEKLQDNEALFLSPAAVRNLARHQ